jgi:hypothetical protein
VAALLFNAGNATQPGSFTAREIGLELRGGSGPCAKMAAMSVWDGTVRAASAAVGLPGIERHDSAVFVCRCVV